MRLIEDWKRLLRYAWSVRLVMLAALLSGAEIVLPMFSDVIPRNTFALLSLLTTIAACIARVVAQPKMREK